MTARFIALVLCVTLALSACSTPAPAVSPSPQPSPSPRLTPYHTTTPVPQATGTLPVPTPIPSLTPTPRSYKVVKGDDLWGIALRHGVPLDVILTANPTVDPNFLKVGTELIIPAAQVTPTPGASTPTPIPVEAAEPACYLDASGGVWCFLLVSSTQNQDVENLSGTILLSAGQDGQLASQAAYPPIDLLPAGRALPLVAYFPPPVLQPFAANGQVNSALFRPAEDARYLPAELAGPQVDVAEGGLSAHVTGTVRLADTGIPAGRVWVLAVAYGKDGKVAGIRKWEAAQPLAAGGTLPFELTVYSLGPEIDKVDLLVEARPGS